ncbi:MAG: response regulator transcription factor [Chloroflexi bacterium]|nr:response regulator transcription factor [Chloroflexota bacterium]
MSHTFTSHSEASRHAAEGSPDEQETREPVSPLQTMLFPAFKAGVATAPTAETGLAAVVVVNAEGKDRNDDQDASRTTAETQAAPQNQLEKPMSLTPSVLIIEDTTELGEVIQATLERMNMVTAHETHGLKALSRFETMQPSVVLLDIGLPDMTGWKFLETIKEKHKGQMPVIIVITAYGDPANRLVGKLQGVFDYLIKPFTANDVEKVVSRALGLV